MKNLRLYPYVFALALLSSFSWAFAQESVSLTTPIAGPPALTVLRPGLMDFNVVSGTLTTTLYAWTGSAYVQDGRAVTCTFTPTTTPTGGSLIVALNKANLSTQSLERRIMLQAATACPPTYPGGLPGTISGTPP